MSDGSHTARKPWPWPGPAEGRPGPAFARTATRPTDSNVWVFRQHQVWVDYYGNEHEIESMPLDYVRNVIDGAVSQAPVSNAARGDTSFRPARPAWPSEPKARHA